MIGAYRPIDTNHKEPTETETQEGSKEYEDQPHARVHPATPGIFIDPHGPDGPDHKN